MKTAASYEITKIRVNPAGGEIEELYINHEKVDMGSDSLQDNKEVTIDASSYTEPVEVTPSSGKVAMKKATVTVSNIPVIESNKAATIDVSAYTEPVEITPTEGKDGMSKATVTLSNIPSGGPDTLYAWENEDEGPCYTLTDTPTTSDKAYVGSLRLASLTGDSIEAVTETTITVNSFVYERNVAGDKNPIFN